MSAKRSWDTQDDWESDELEEESPEQGDGGDNRGKGSSGSGP